MSEKTGKLKGVGSGIALSFLMSFLLCIYAPIDLYLTNFSEFWMRPSLLIPPIAVLFVGIFAVLSLGFIVAKLINSTFYKICLGIVSGTFIGLYIQGNFFLKNLPSMDGTKPVWSDFPAERLKSIIAFAVPILVMVALFVIFRKKEKTLKNATVIGSLCISLMLIFTLTFLFISTDTTKKRTLTSTYTNEFVMSNDKNMVVLILDAVDGDKFTEALERDGELADELDGFTYYDDALSSYPYTSRSLPMIFSGKWYENDSKFSNYRMNAFDKSPLISKLESEKYNIGIYEKYDMDLSYDVFKNRFDNCIAARMDYSSRYSYELILSMAAVKYAPWDLKHYGWELDRYQQKCRYSDATTTAFDWSDLTFYNSIKNENPICVADEKSARIIHLHGAHVPFQYDKKLEKILDEKDASYESNIDACVTLLKQYIARLKESGVYDNSAIVILADHGYSCSEEYNDEYILGRMHPMLMMKGIGEKHSLQYSSAPIAYEDLADAFVKLLDGSTGDKVFKYTDNSPRTRRAIIYAYGKEDYMYEILTDGNANDISSMKKTGKEYIAK